MTIDYIVPNNKLACEPFGSLAVEVVGQSRGFAIAKQKNALVSTKVVFDANAGNVHYIAYYVGDEIFLRGDVQTLHWCREVFTVDDKKFILVPLDHIQFAKRSGK